MHPSIRFLLLATLSTGFGCSRPLAVRPHDPKQTAGRNTILYALPKSTLQFEFEYARKVTNFPVCRAFEKIESDPDKLEKAIEKAGLAPVIPAGAKPEEKATIWQRALLFREIEAWKASGRTPESDESSLSFKNPKLSTSASPDMDWVFGINTKPAGGVRRTSGVYAFEADGRPSSLSSADTNNAVDLALSSVEYALKIASAAVAPASVPKAGSGSVSACDIAVREAAMIVANAADKAAIAKTPLAELRAATKSAVETKTGKMTCSVSPSSAPEAGGVEPPPLVLFSRTSNAKVHVADGVDCVASDPTLLDPGDGSDAVSMQVKLVPERGLSTVASEADLEPGGSANNTDRKASGFYRAPGMVTVVLSLGDTLLLRQASVPIAQYGKVRALPDPSSFNKRHSKVAGGLDPDTGSLLKLEVEYGKSSAPSLSGIGGAASGIIDAAQSRAKDNAPKSPKDKVVDDATDQCAKALLVGEWSDFCALVGR